MLRKPVCQGLALAFLVLLSLAAAGCGAGQSTTTQGASSTTSVAPSTSSVVAGSSSTTERQAATTTSGVPETTTEQGASTTATPPASVAPSPSFLPGSWTRQSPLGDQPPARALQSTVYATTIDRALLFGGSSLDSDGNPSDDLNDLWSYDPRTSAWQQLHPTTPSPSARDEFAMGFDMKSGKMLLFGGKSLSDLSDTWAYDPGNETWTELKPRVSPPGGSQISAIVYDPDSEQMLLVVSWTLAADDVQVWAYDWAANTWAEVKATSPAPAARKTPSVVYADAAHRLVMIGGTNDNGAVGEVWLFDPASGKWSKQKDLASQGLGKVALGTPQTAAYDPKGDRIIFSTTGLDKSGAEILKTFSYAPSADRWTDVTPGGSKPSPPAMLKVASFAYDAQLGAFILSEGVTGTDTFTPNNDVWIYAPPRP